MQRLSATFLALALALPAGIFAQEPVQSGNPHTVHSQNNRSQQPPGVLQTAILREAVRMRAEFASVPPRSQAGPGSGRQSWAARHPVLLGALIGGGAGAGLAASMCIEGGNPDVPCGLGVAQDVTVFAGLGSLVGFLLSRH